MVGGVEVLLDGRLAFRVVKPTPSPIPRDAATNTAMTATSTNVVLLNLGPGISALVVESILGSIVLVA